MKKRKTRSKRSSLFSIIMAFLFLILLSFFTSPATATPLYNICGTTGNFTTGNSTYSSNLNTLLTTLSSNTSATGFTTFTTGSIPNSVIGLSLCRGDTDITNCRTCISTAISDIQQLCPNKKEATIWYDNCQLRYSNQNFLYAPDVSSSNKFFLWNGQNVSADQLSWFESLILELMGNISDLAVRNTSRLFATGETVLTAGSVIYGLVQCTLDLSASDCRTCLQGTVDMITQVPLKGERGGRTLGLWCNMRYEFYKFYNGKSMLQLTPAQPPVSTVNSTGFQADASNGGNQDNTAKKVLIISLPVALALVCVIFIIVLRRKKSLKWLPTRHPVQKNMRSIESLLFDLETIKKATNDFSDENKLGEGGFGPVYKGLLDDGQQIAVKRLSSTSRQGFIEMRNEVALVAKLQHKNLVKLLGCCLEHNEMLLVYEYLPKTSLDKYLFDPTERPLLDWGTRYKIIEGIGRGLLYLHEDSRLKIIHRDLKASNILLSNNMAPKISDFGIARLLDIDQTQQNTSRIAGTRGYMAPEYAMHGVFSTKSDVFSYGVLILEIITGRNNGVFTDREHDLDLLSSVWKYWNQGSALQVVDQCLGQKYQPQEVLRCLNIGLLCVQDDPLLRPSMNSVMVMISSYSTSIPAPLMPPFYIGNSSSQDSEPYAR